MEPLENPSLETFKTQEARAALGAGLALRLLEQSMPEAPSNPYTSGSPSVWKRKRRCAGSWAGCKVVAPALCAAGRLRLKGQSVVADDTRWGRELQAQLGLMRTALAKVPLLGGVQLGHGVKEELPHPWH